MQFSVNLRRCFTSERRACSALLLVLGHTNGLYFVLADADRTAF
jgi:hypothetical protein